MRLKKVSVTGLFGLFDHEIPLHLDERITIVHGPNGYGKTLVLRMTAGLLTGRYSVFNEVPFSLFTLEFDDGESLTIKRITEPQRDSDEPRGKGRPTLEISLSARGAKPQSYKLPGIPVARTQLSLMLERFVPFLAQIGPEDFLDRRTGKRISLDDAFELYADELPPTLGKNRDERKSAPSWLKELRSSIPVRFIQTQRLDVAEAGEDKASKPAVEVYSQELVDSIRKTLAAYAARSQELDRTFPTRLFSNARSEQLDVEELRHKLVELEQKRSELTVLGFLEPEQGPSQAPEQALEQKRDVLSIYVADVAKKLEVFDDLAAKIQLLTRIVNERFNFKQLKIHRDRGFVFTSETGSPLRPADLSSGEQHELILLYELLFKLKKNALVLVDEPEISLHVAWQEKFLPDLAEMVKLSEVDVLIATHSSEIIGEHWDLTVELKAPSKSRQG